LTDGGVGRIMLRAAHTTAQSAASCSTLSAGFRFPPEVIVLAVRWNLRFGLSYRDVEELLAGRASRSTTSRFTGGCNASRRC
jgi:hypothetical protein